MAAPKRQPFEIERDRAAITQSYLRGVTQANIAEQLGLSRQQIGYDLGKIQEGWRTQTALDLDHHKAQQLAKLDELERTHWQAWEESKQDKEVKTAKTYNHGNGSGTECTLRKEGQVGSQSFLDGVLKCIQQRCRILGLELPPAVIQQNLLVNHRQEPLVFHVVYDDDGYGSENGSHESAALPEPEPEQQQQLEAAPVESIEEPETLIEEDRPIERTSRRRDTGSRREDVEELETVAQRQNKNLIAFLSEP